MPDGCSEHDIPGFDEFKKYNLQCEKCGCFLKSDADLAEPTADNGLIKQTRKCKRCGWETVWYV